MLDVIFALVLFATVAIVIYFCFEWQPFTIALLATISILVIKPDVSKKLIKEQHIPYYAVFILLALLFSSEETKCCKNKISLVVTAILVMLINFYIESTLLSILSIFLNLYIIILLLFLYLK